MTGTLRHRGPDGEGFFVDPERAVFLGHRRLAVLDVESGTQPMFNEDGSVVIIFNGEIYNHLQLRTELIAAGHRFKSHHSDTEVLVHGYEEWGEALLPRLNGMFAFAIYDKARSRILLTRDRFGEKPLFYWRRNGVFGFASEMQALRRHPLFDEPVDPRSLRKYFCYGFIPSPHCLWRNCAKLPGGSYAIYDVASGRLETRRYWTFQLEPDDRFNAVPEEEVTEELRALLKQAVARRLLSDVPLGIFLSGGVDSSAALALATGARNGQPLDTFTISFDDPSFDESAYARRMAEFAGARHHEERLSLGRMKELIGAAIGSLDEPIADPSILPTYMLCRFTRQSVTVALSGDGGDELFAGYDPFRALNAAELYNRFVPRFGHEWLKKAARHLPMSTRNMSFDFRLRRLLAGLSYSRPFWNPVWLSPVEPAELRDLFGAETSAEEVFDDAVQLWDENPGLSLEEQTLMFYTRFYLQDNILVKVDRAAMASSLETRAIFLDNDLVEFSRRLPYRLKYRGGRGKYILRNSLRGLVPQDLLDRPKKGFGIPVSAWLREVPAEPPLRSLDSVNLSFVKSRWVEHRNRHADHRMFLWSWLAAQSVTAEAA